MAVSASGVADLVAELLSTARAGVRVTVETNITPPVQLFGGEDDGRPRLNLAGLVGIKGGLVVRNARGDVLARIGEPAPFEPLRAALVLLAVGGVGYLVWRAVR